MRSTPHRRAVTRVVGRVIEHGRVIDEVSHARYMGRVELDSWALHVHVVILGQVVRSIRPKPFWVVWATHVSRPTWAYNKGLWAHFHCLTTKVARVA